MHTHNLKCIQPDVMLCGTILNKICESQNTPFLTSSINRKFLTPRKQKFLNESLVQFYNVSLSSIFHLLLQLKFRPALKSSFSKTCYQTFTPVLSNILRNVQQRINNLGYLMFALELTMYS